MILAIRLLAVPMLNVQTEYAHVYLNIKATLTQGVDLSVSLTMIVLVTSPVSRTNVSTLVLVLVVKMQFAMWSITFQCVPVLQAQVETLLFSVLLINVCILISLFTVSMF